MSGSRDWGDVDYVRAVLKAYPAEASILIHGAAPGLDTIADYVGKELGYAVKAFPADWTPLHPGQSYNPLAGPERNQEMVDFACTLRNQGDEVYCECFPLPQSRGTYDFIDRAHAAGLRVHRLGWTTFTVPEMDGLSQFTHIIRGPDDPDETIVRGRGGNPIAWRNALKDPPSVWRDRIIQHLSDGVARTFNRLVVELTGRTADIAAGKPPDEGLWEAVREGVVEYTFADSPVYFRLRTQ